MANLSIWSNDSDWFIAESAEDAEKQFYDLIGNHTLEGEEEWFEDNKPFWTLTFEEESDRDNEAPEGAELGRHASGLYYAKATQEQWIAKKSRCYFCSDNW